MDNMKAETESQSLRDSLLEIDKAVFQAQQWSELIDWPLPKGLKQDLEEIKRISKEAQKDLEPYLKDMQWNKRDQIQAEFDAKRFLE